MKPKKTVTVSSRVDGTITSVSFKQGQMVTSGEVLAQIDPQFRPIMMTTMAAMLGGVPLMLGTGTGSELRQPLGYAIVGGLPVGQVLTPRKRLSGRRTRATVRRRPKRL